MSSRVRYLESLERKHDLGSLPHRKPQQHGRAVDRGASDEFTRQVSMRYTQ